MITRHSISVVMTAMVGVLSLAACNKRDPAPELSTATALKTTAKTH